VSNDTFERVRKCLAEVLALDPDTIAPGSKLIGDLGAESLDLVELMYLLEQEFNIRLEQEDLSLSAQLGLPEEEIHQNEVLTPRALELLRARYPDAHEILKPGVTRGKLANLLTVAEVARSLEKKISP
jgi:acyl carrier protein